MSHAHDVTDSQRDAEPAAPAPGTATATDPGPDLEAVEAGFRSYLDARFGKPLHDALDRYGASLRRIVDAMAALAPENPDPAGTAQERAGIRHAFAARFVSAFRDDLLDPADRDREELFVRLQVTGGDGAGGPDLPETVTAPPAGPGAPTPDPRIRPGPARRLLGVVRRNRDRQLPARALARFYTAELVARLEEAASLAASLDSIALATVRRQLHDIADPVRPPRPEAPAPAGPPRREADLAGTLAAAGREIDAAIEEIGEAFARALRAPAVRVDPEHAPAILERAGRRRDRLRRDWESFEAALHANTASEAVLARALASLDATTARAASELDRALERQGHAPLTRLSRGLQELADEAATLLHEDPPAGAVQSLRTAAATLFEAELPALLRDLPVELDAAAEGFLAALDRIPDTVPGDLRISERRIDGVPDRPEPLELRDAPVDELVATACRGALPRSTQRAMTATAEELEALRQELLRVQNAVDFHIRAPLRGDFDRDEAADLVVDIVARSASQLEDLRETGLDAVERMIAEMERRSVEEAEAVRSAVAEREFLRIRSEIAEEQAVRHLSRSAEWGRRLVETALRLGRRGWTAGRRTYELTHGWAQRHLGVGEVEREEMLESLEASLLGGDRHGVALPGLYRQLFDVEGEVPWEELLVSRDEELDALERALERWRRGQSGAVAVVGEKGSGKTTLLRMAADSLFGDLPVRTLDIGSTVQDPDDLRRRMADGLELDAATWPDLAAALRERRPAVVVVEDAHHLFIRALGGFRSMETFLELLNATRRDVFWILTMDEYAWRYLDRVMGIAPHFTHVVTTTNLSPERLERAVMGRHEVSGFSLEFEMGADRPTGTRWWSRFRRKEPQGELTRRERDRGEFFRELTQIAEGNIFLGLFYWLRSIRRVEDHVLVLGHPQMIDLEFLERLPLPSLHTIAGIILHGGLSEGEHQRIFQLDAAESRLQLATLTDAHLVFRAYDGEYKVNKVLYRPLTRLLKARNIF